MGEEKDYINEMDKEWLTLILEAKNLGFKKEEIRDFFRKKEIKELISEG
ncbi:DNA-binding anti-repressor SinI [Lederbergia citri]|nr:DNA-binding anti-repressor SinI [Lederbergia citri]